MTIEVTGSGCTVTNHFGRSHEVRHSDMKPFHLSRQSHYPLITLAYPRTVPFLAEAVIASTGYANDLTCDGANRYLEVFVGVMAGRGQ